MTSHKPAETRTNTIRVTCAASGRGEWDDGLERHQYWAVTLADVEAWTAELRRLGAPDGLELPGGAREYLDVTLGQGSQ